MTVLGGNSIVGLRGVGQCATREGRMTGPTLLAAVCAGALAPVVTAEAVWLGKSNVGGVGAGRRGSSLVGTMVGC